MYNGEELIDTLKVDINDEEVMKKISSTLSDMYYEGDKALRGYRDQLDINMEKANMAIAKSDVEKIEKRKTIISKLLYIIGSAFKPELMPVEMYRKQEMPAEKRARFNEYNAKSKEYQTRIQGHIEALNKFKMKYEDMWKNALLSNESKISFLNKLNNVYANTKTSLKSMDTLLMYRMMETYDYMTTEDEEKYASHGIGFLGTNMHDKLKELNNWYVNQFGGEKTR